MASARGRGCWEGSGWPPSCFQAHEPGLAPVLVMDEAPGPELTRLLLPAWGYGLLRSDLTSEPTLFPCPAQPSLTNRAQNPALNSWVLSLCCDPGVIIPCLSFPIPCAPVHLPHVSDLLVYQAHVILFSTCDRLFITKEA